MLILENIFTLHSPLSILVVNSNTDKQKFFISMHYKNILLCFFLLLPITSIPSAGQKVYAFQTDKNLYIFTCAALLTTVVSILLLKKLLHYFSHNDDISQNISAHKIDNPTFLKKPTKITPPPTNSADTDADELTNATRTVNTESKNLNPTIQNILTKLSNYKTKVERMCVLNVFMQEAIRLNNNPILLFLLKDQGASPNFIYQEQGLYDNDSLFCALECKDPYIHGRGLLAYACWLNQEESVKMLLEYGADPDNAKMTYETKGTFGCDSHQYHYRTIHNVKNPLFIACYNNNLGIVQLLTQHNTKTHPFSVYTDLDLDDPLYENASNYIKDFDDDREIPVSCIHLALFNKNHSIFNHLMEYTLRKNIPDAVTTLNRESINQCFACDTTTIWQNSHEIEYELVTTQSKKYHKRLIKQIECSGFMQHNKR